MVECKICNKEFKNLSNLSKHLNFHNISPKKYYDKYLKKENEGICPMFKYIPSCKKETKFDELKKGYRKFCSVKCSRNSIETKQKYISTNLRKYNVENVSQLDKIKNKKINTCIKNFGVENPTQNKKIKEKIEKINFEKYGCKNIFQNKFIQEKQRKTNIEKYGCEFPLQNEEIKKKSSIIKHKKYILKLSKILCYLNIELLDSEYINNLHDHKWKCKLCNYEFIQKWDYIQQGYRCQRCYPREIGYSKGEKEISFFIKSLNLKVIENSREIINSHELDIYIPDKNTAIEFDGLYWHSELFKTKNYHLDKTVECESKNIQLIHIFEDEWIFKQDIVKSRLKQLFGLNNNLPKIYARKCEIKEISPKLKNDFLNKYHIQGEDRSSIKLGAFYNSELISVMTFSKGSIAKGSKNIDNIWELNRFCSNNNYHIIGIASKLLSYFKNNIQWKEIYSYADRRWSLGNLYYKLGFELDSITKPNYWYIKNSNRIHRFNLRKKSNESKDIPEWILRQYEGYYRIWDCGHYKFRLKKGNKFENNQSEFSIK